MRASLACYSDHDDIDRLAAGLAHLTAAPPPFTYRLDPDGQFNPDTRPGWLSPRLSALLDH